MGKKDSHIIIPPTFFRCPISLDIMNSPVILSTGVTYDRVNIQRWLENGNNTCPATMQVLENKDFVPNHTLHRLIQIWSNNHSPPTKQPFRSISTAQVVDLISRVVSPCSGEALVESYSKILCFLSESKENVKFVGVNKEFVSKLVEILGLESPDLEPDLLEPVLKILRIIIITSEKRHKVVFLPSLILNFAKILKIGSLDSRIAVAGILEATAGDVECKKVVLDGFDHLCPALLEIIRQNLEIVSGNDREIHAALSCLISLITTRRNKLKFIQLGGVQIITNMISKVNEKNDYKMTEFLLTLLEMCVGCTEGRVAVMDDPRCVSRVIGMIMKGSSKSNEHGIALLWSLCYLFRDQKSKEAVRKSNGGLSKILLLMQSDCKPCVKRMCCDLIRIFKVNSKSCFSSFDSMTSHIMPC